MTLLLEGQIFDGTYQLLRIVGEGGMGTVYEATHARLAGRYAIKVLLEKLSENPDALARFDREARITSLLQHPNVVQVIDHNTAADGTEYLVMEYLAGESLAQRLSREGRLPLDAVVGIVDQIAAGLAAAHAHGIVHRDLKPDNVFLMHVEGRDTELVKLLDFGISKVCWGAEAPDGEICGTPQYMAPEQVEGRVTDVDGATDQYALAVIAYEMLTGRNPFQGDTVAAIFSLVSQGVAPSAGISPDVDSVIQRGLAKSNRQRFHSVTDFSDAFRAAATGLVPESQAQITLADAADAFAAFEGQRRTRRRNWGLALSVAVATSISMAFLVRPAASHLAGRALVTVAAKAHPAAIAAVQVPAARQVALTDRTDGAAVPRASDDRSEALRDHRSEALRDDRSEALRDHRSEALNSEEMERLHGGTGTGNRSPSTTHDRHAREIGPTSSPSPFASRSHPRAPSPVDEDAPLPLDEDATMPLEEAGGSAR